MRWGSAAALGDLSRLEKRAGGTQVKFYRGKGKMMALVGDRTPDSGE